MSTIPKIIKVEKFNVRFVKTGDKYGLNDCLNNADEPMVEFYDSRFPDFDKTHNRGQFVSRYYAATLLASDYPGGLCLDGGHADIWSVSADGMVVVKWFIKSQP